MIFSTFQSLNPNYESDDKTFAEFFFTNLSKFEPTRKKFQIFTQVYHFIAINKTADKS